MTPKQKKRAFVVSCIAVGISLSAALAITAFQDTLLYFLTPTDIVTQNNIPDKNFRLGGLVADNSFLRLDGIEVQFAITDLQETITVRFEGILPDLFREGQGVIVKGQLNPDNLFIAEEVLAKHDENYMPPEVQEALDKNLDKNKNKYNYNPN